MAERDNSRGAWQRAVASRQREKLRRELGIDALGLGDRVPKNAVAACVIGISDKKAGDHMNALLAELNIVWEDRYVNGFRARVVIKAPIPGLFV